MSRPLDRVGSFHSAGQLVSGGDRDRDRDRDHRGHDRRDRDHSAAAEAAEVQVCNNKAGQDNKRELGTRPGQVWYTRPESVQYIRPGSV